MDDAARAASGQGCVFARALMVHAAGCACAQRRSIGEREVVVCGSPQAHRDCGMLAALMHERARFALRLPRPGEPLMHAQAMRLQCGGLAGLAQALGAEAADPVLPDVHALVGRAHERHGGLAALPWASIVASMRAWAPRRRRAP